MTKTRSIFLAALFCLLSTAFAQTPKPQIGKWRDHLAHTIVKTIANADTRVYAGGVSGLFYYDKEDGSVHRMTKVQGFSDFNVTNLAYYKKKDALVIVYENSNIDLYINDVVYNISDIKRTTNFPAKRIYSVTFEENFAYLSCDFGILVLDLDRKEIYNTYSYLGDGGTQMKIHAVAFNDTAIFAASDNRLYAADRKDPLLIDYSRWGSIDDTLFTNTENTLLEVNVFQDKLIVLVKQGSSDTNFYFRNENKEWKPFYKGSYIKTQVRNNQYFVIKTTGVSIFNADLVKVDSIVSKPPCYKAMQK